jgi:hypothetical protein
MELHPYQCPTKTGKESFHLNGDSIGPNILSFWQWSSSDLLGNALRGVLAEYIVSLDAHCSTEMRDVWDAYDLITTGGVKIEVKSASYLQSWNQKNYSKISFGIQPTFGWDAKTGLQSKVQKRQADVYVFCVITHRDKLTADPLDLAQWVFYVLPTRILDKDVPRQKTIALSSLLQLNPAKCQFGQMSDAITSLASAPDGLGMP